MSYSYLDSLMKLIDGNDVLQNIDTMLRELERVAFRWVALREADLSKQCTCVQESEKGLRQASASCKRCFGSGYVFTDYLVKGFEWVFTPATHFQAELGQMSTQVRHFVVRRTRPLKKFDFLVDLDINPDTGVPKQPFKMIRVYQIQDVRAFSGRGGRVEFWKCTAEERTLTTGPTNIERTSFSHRVYV